MWKIQLIHRQQIIAFWRDYRAGFLNRDVTAVATEVATAVATADANADFTAAKNINL